MGSTKGFLEFEREAPVLRSVRERVQDYHDVYLPLPVKKIKNQAARCMDCGIPFCQSGCPLGNIIPDWNSLVHRGQWRQAYERLRATNNFPEFTGRICPAPCESACVLGLIGSPVTIENIEREIIDRAYREGWVRPEPPEYRTGKSVAVVGSGPSGLACADQLNKVGHHVTVMERDDRIGGLLRYGIPDFKLEKWILDRRLEVMRAEGVEFLTRVNVGQDCGAEHLKSFDAVALCVGATAPRDLKVPGRELNGVHFAFDYLRQQNKRVYGDDLTREETPLIHARDKHVIVIGGGDTGSDCVGTANRQGAASITQFELLPTPPDERPGHQPWPYYPMILRTSSSHQEGVQRQWSIMTHSFEGVGGQVKALRTNMVEGYTMKKVPGSAKAWPADLVLLAIGYTGPERSSMLRQLGVRLTEKGNLWTDGNYATSVPGIFAAGDARRGQSLIVWAISEGREAARAVDAHLSGVEVLPTKGEGDLPMIR